jgi:hypothetical protein
VGGGAEVDDVGMAAGPVPEDVAPAIAVEIAADRLVDASDGASAATELLVGPPVPLVVRVAAGPVPEDVVPAVAVEVALDRRPGGRLLR